MITLKKSQYFISLVLLFLFTLGLFPGQYKEVGTIIAILLLIQMFLSLYQFRIIVLIFEFFLLLFALLSFIPFLGVLFKLLAIFILLFELASHKGTSIEYRFTYRNFNPKDFEQKVTSSKLFSGFKKKNQKKYNKKVVDVEFEEK
jgi:predicted membrane protein